MAAINEFTHKSIQDMLAKKLLERIDADMLLNYRCVQPVANPRIVEGEVISVREANLPALEAGQ